MVLLRLLLHAGQIRGAGSEALVGFESEEEVLKVIGTTNLRDRG